MVGVKRKVLSAPANKIYDYLSTIQDKTFPGATKLIDILGMSKSVVDRALDELVYLEVLHSRTKGTNVKLKEKPTERVEKNCLRCRKQFLPAHKNIFICTSCSETNKSWSHLEGI